MNLRLIARFDQGLAKVRVWTEVKRGVSVLVLQVQVGGISGQELSDGGAAVSVHSLSTDPHQHLPLSRHNLLLL